MRDVVIIGAGHNGLVTAAFLANAGFAPLVLERLERVGGCAITTELAPGFRCPTLAHSASIDPAIVLALDLEQHGLRIATPMADACAPTLDRRALVLWADVQRAAESIRTFSSHDEEQYPRFLRSYARISRVLHAVMSAEMPSLEKPTLANVIGMLRAARQFRALGKTDAYRLLRWMPMAVADLASEWFESEPLRATVAAGGVLGSFLGPCSAGSAAVLLLLGATSGRPIASGWLARGGTGAVADALARAAKEAGADIRTAAEVVRVTVDDGVATGVVLASGEEIAARSVVSNADPKRTLLGFVDPVHLTPEFIERLQNVRARGTLAKVNYALSTLPTFTGLASRDAGQQAAALSGRIRLSTDIHAIERAFDAMKYGSFSPEPWIELTIPSISDPALAPSQQHVISAYVQYAPYHLRGTTWNAEREHFGLLARKRIEQFAPGFESAIVAEQVITPVDLERIYGLTGGHIFHGELALDQLFVSRPLLGWARHETPIRNLFLCGCGTHPGAGLNGRSGALAAKAIAQALRKRGRWRH